MGLDSPGLGLFVVTSISQFSKPEYIHHLH